MPRKGGKSILALKQKRAITTRLMQISIVLDDYVYKHQPITADQANMFIEEVAMYKASCLKDPRSLQVIEKLTRCMRKIIEENEESTVENDNMDRRDSCYVSNNTTENIPQNTYDADTCVSPTFSYINVDEVEPIDEMITKEKSKGDASENNTNDEHVESDHTNINKASELERTISTLSLKEKNAQEEANDGSYSQSILLNFENNDNGVIENECGQDIEAFTEEIALITNAKATTNNIKTVNSQIIDNAHENARRVTRKSNENLSFKKGKINNRISKRKPQVSNNSSIVTVAASKNKEIPKSSVKTKPVFCPPFAREAKRMKAPSNSNDMNISDTIQFKGSKASVDRNDKAKARTKSNLVNDLSWIENIKYVREVTMEEMDPRLNNLSEIFWDSFSLPPVWDELDFEY